MSRRRHTSRLAVGCAGYDYKEWRGEFYPADLAHDRWFGYYADRFGAVEINNTFYNLPDADTFDRWRSRAPEGFRYAVKLSRYGTHMKRLKDPGQWLGRFLERVERLEDHLGPILVQLPPKWGRDLDRLAAFLEVAPRRRSWAFEFRDPDWLCDDVFDLLRRPSAALVLHDMIDDHPRPATADWIYIRYHGASSSRPYAGRYSPQKLTADARQYAAWIREGKALFIFFNNDVGACAPDNAQQLERYVRSALDS